MTAQTTFRTATRADLPAILALLADDPLGKNRETRDSPAYRAAFDAIAADPNQQMAVAELSGAVIGYMQISFIPGLSRGGAWRGQLESVRIATTHRGPPNAAKASARSFSTGPLPNARRATVRWCS